MNDFYNTKILKDSITLENLSIIINHRALQIINRSLYRLIIIIDQHLDSNSYGDIRGPLTVFIFIFF